MKVEQGIETIALKHDWPGWWSKIELFAPGNFPQDDRVIFLDLDTIVLGDFEGLARDDVHFAMLTDFYHPRRKGSGVMSWKGDYSKLYVDLVDNEDGILAFRKKNLELRKPARMPMEQIFIENELVRHYRPATAIQNLISVASYKVHCEQGPPTGTQIVCFHGEPRPWEVNDGWVKNNYPLLEVTEDGSSSGN